ncbi:MAG TPA: zf-HC2 domain-containing protein [Pseudonocardiaceae bacterium]
MTEPNCQRFRDVAAELALGVLPARERAQALAHLDECPDCVEHLRSLTEIGDGLLELVPGVEPPVGFESRVLRRLGHGGTGGLSGRWRRQRWLPITLAAAVAAVAFGIGGWALGGHTQSAVPGPAAASSAPAGAVLRTASLVGAGDRQLGVVFAYAEPGGRPTVYMAVDTGGVSGPVACQLERAGGAVVQVGSFTVTGGYGTWASPVSVDPNTLVGARLVSDTGAVLATGTFSHS